MPLRIYCYTVERHRNVETANCVCVGATRSRKDAISAAEGCDRWRRLGWNISLGRRTVTSTGEVWWEVWAHATPALSLKPIAKIDRVQVLE